MSRFGDEPKPRAWVIILVIVLLLACGAAVLLGER